MNKRKTSISLQDKEPPKLKTPITLDDILNNNADVDDGTNDEPIDEFEITD